MPLPQVLRKFQPHLDGSERTADESQRLSLLENALEDTRSYGEILWKGIEGLRAYLLSSLPPDPRAPGPHGSSASPTGPDDEDGWQRWMAAYAEATSALAGPQGDSGYGWREARHEAGIRRNAPNVRLLARHPELAPASPLTADHRAGRKHSRPTSRTILSIVVATLATQHLVGRRLRKSSW
jgi:hypothetical protein